VGTKRRDVFEPSGHRRIGVWIPLDVACQARTPLRVHRRAPQLLFESIVNFKERLGEPIPLFRIFICSLKLCMQLTRPLDIRVDIDASSTGGSRVRRLGRSLLNVTAVIGGIALSFGMGAFVLRCAVGLAIAAAILWLTTLSCYPLANLPKRCLHCVIAGLLVGLHAAFPDFVKFRLEPFQSSL
jgi:phage shock protein PspC (stress-responsive transcriptional regulator)